MIKKVKENVSEGIIDYIADIKSNYFDTGMDVLKRHFKKVDGVKVLRKGDPSKTLTSAMLIINERGRPTYEVSFTAIFNDLVKVRIQDMKRAR
ncbi:hypothetical protein D4T97_010020 [Siminovitchia acidinfaciens]|uniref:Uncharacterized protein n=1 Tax=Siminovitchia acidinfaciens TaxID=2321395 RepID=A0A429Y2W6_9BACI|nr:hypothetical protein [Siminovitchia acidinfaciens]RST75560.1 hypothetical protein D4T97_010020 [Siminovitchia acidinfaciens]